MNHLANRPLAPGPFFDVVIVGGGSVGSATAWHLLLQDSAISVAVVEPDSSYRLAATSTASGGVRQLFTCPENVLLSQYTHQIIRDWDLGGTENAAAGTDLSPDLGWRPNGYLLIADQGHASSCQLERNLSMQTALGVDARWLDPDQIHELFPHIQVADRVPGILSPQDGWLDPLAFLRGMRARAEHLGAVYVADRVLDFEVGGRMVTGVRLRSGAVLRGGAVINVAGVWGPELSAQLGLTLPVEPMRRFDHYVETSADFRDYPFVKDPGGLAVRPEGEGLTAAVVDFAQPGGHDLSIDRAYFDVAVRPSLVQRFPILGDLRLVSTWAGLYDQNRLDGNMVIDCWSGNLDNYFFATGFSGHGLMHAPAIGRALSELVVHSEYRTIDLARLGLGRVYTSTPYSELAIR